MNRLTLKLGVLALTAIMLASSLPAIGDSSVRAIWGPTPIVEGEAISQGDLTVINEYLAVTFGVGTLPPWGVTRGHIIDLAPVVNGVPMADVIAQFSFPVDGWGNWATYEKFEVVENSSERVVVKAIGYWKDIRVEMTYTFEAGKNYVYIVTKLTNTGNTEYRDLVSGYAISLKKGWTFTPGFGTGRQYAPTLKEEVGAIEDWVSGYHEDFAVAILAPYYTHLSTSTGWVDPFTIHTLRPGESRVFEGYLIVEPKGDICKIREDIMEIKGESGGIIEGRVLAGNDPVPNPIVMVFKDGKPYCWSIGEADGRYRIKLPEGDYVVQATSKGYGLSSVVPITIKAGLKEEIDIVDVTKPGTVKVNVRDSRTGEPLDAVIKVRGGDKPIVKYLEVSVVYTDPENIGYAEFQLPPGIYTLEIGRGAGFTAKPVVFEGLEVPAGGTVAVDAFIDRIDPSGYGWYSADLHHHSDYLDGRTPPEYVIVAQSAAELDFVFISDHDYTGNYAELARLAATRGMPFIPSVEVSPNWAHFNPYPLPLDVDYKPIRGDACNMIAEMRSLGAIVVRINHPYTGYFSTWEKGEIPGGYCEDWDVAEINGWWGRSDEATLKKMWELWNMGVTKYITAGSDVHDIWSSPYSGYPRVYAYIEGEPTPEKFALAEKSGRTYITYGPLILSMNPLPGSTIISDGLVKISVNLYSIDGLSKLEVISEGEKVKEILFQGEQAHTLDITLDLTDKLEDKHSWIQLIIQDKDEDRAITNPIWIIDRSLASIQSEEIIPKPEVITETVTKTITVQSTTTATYTKVDTRTVEKPVTETITATLTETETVRESRIDPTTLIVILIVGVIIGALASRLAFRS